MTGIVSSMADNIGLGERAVVLTGTTHTTGIVTDLGIAARQPLQMWLMATAMFRAISTSSTGTSSSRS